MPKSEIDLVALKDGLNAVLDHIIKISDTKHIAIVPEKDYYWDIPTEHLYSVSGGQPKADIGRLTDDWDFVQQMLRDKDTAVGAMLLHLAPLLRRVGEEIGR